MDRSEVREDVGEVTRLDDGGRHLALSFAHEVGDVLRAIEERAIDETHADVTEALGAVTAGALVRVRRFALLGIAVRVIAVVDGIEVLVAGPRRIRRQEVRRQ